MPEASATPRRSASRPEPSRPASAHACSAATMANWLDRSRRRALTRSRTSDGSTATRPPIFTGSWSTHSSVRRLMPDVPDSIACHVEATSPPTGEVVPRPVTTTRVEGICWGSVLAGCGSSWVTGAGAGHRPPVTWGRASALSALDVGDGVAHGLEVLDLVVRDGHAELLLGGHDDLDHGERVDVEVVHEGLVQLDVVGVDAGHLVDDLGEVGADFFGAGHGPSLLLCGCCLGWSAGGAGQGTVTTWAA